MPTKKGLIPGRTVNPAPKVNMKGIVKPKGENLPGKPRTAGLHPKKTPGKGRFSAVTKIEGL